MNTVKVRARKGFRRVCVAALFSLALAACGDGQDVGANDSLPTSVEKTGLAAEWLSDTPMVPTHAQVGFDTTGIVQLTAEGPIHHYEAGKMYGNCVVVYHSYGDGTYDVAIKPIEDVGANDQGSNIPADQVDAWINQFVRDCKQDTF